MRTSGRGASLSSNTHKAEGNGQALRSQPGERLDADNYLRRLVHRQLHGAADHPQRIRSGLLGQLLSRSRRGSGLSAVGQLFDLVLIDTPAVLAASDALSVAGQADGIVLLLPHRVLLRNLREVQERLTFVKTPLLGYVFVRPSGGVLERWTRRVRRQEARRQRKTRKRVADANGHVGEAHGEGAPVSSARRSGP